MVLSDRPKNLVEILRVTLHELEQAEDLRAEDPAIHELKNSLVRAVAELSIQRARANVEPCGPLGLLPAPQSSTVSVPATQEPPEPLPDLMPAPKLDQQI